MDLKQAKELIGGQFSFMADSVEKIVKHLALNKDSKILDIGTGIGKMAIILALHGYKVLTGEPMDDDTEYAKQDWRENAKKVGVDHLISFKFFNAETMPFDDESFDAVFIFGSFHHFKDKEVTLKECFRVIHFDGLVCIIEPSKKNIEIIKKRRNNHPDYADPKDFIGNLPVKIEHQGDSEIDAYLITKK